MPILQLTRTPVSVYKSTDDQAPQLAATPGSLKTILEACLVTGYGSKQGLGWEMPFSSATAAAFKSKSPDSTGCYLYIDNSGARYADLHAFIEMTALGVGSSQFIDDEFRRYPTLYSNKQTTPWVLIGHGKAFWFFLKSTYYDDHSHPVFFGDFPSYSMANKANALALNIYSHNTHTSISTNYSTTWSINNNRLGLFAARSWDGLKTAAPLSVNSRCMQYAGAAYPDLITGGLQADAVDIHEFISPDSRELALRGRLPGAYYCANDLSSVPEFTEISGFDGTDDTFIKVRLDGNSRTRKYNIFLINATAWLT